MRENKTMLEQKSKLVLKFLIQECPNGAYKIIESRDIISSMPAKYKLDNEAFDNILTYLERQDCISIKYDDNNVYCLCVLPYGYEILEKETRSKKEDKKSSRLWYIVLINLLVSFLAGVLGTVIAHILIPH